MSFWGVGYPVIQTLDSNDNVDDTYNLPNTNDRNVDPYQLVEDNRVNPVNKRVIQRIFGYRPVFRFLWIFDRDERVNPVHELQDLINIANTRGYMKLYPHYEITHIWYYVHVTDVKIGYNAQTTRVNEIEIEFTGRDLITEIPIYNPWIAAPLDEILVVSGS